jgi:hypothetical protein
MELFTVKMDRPNFDIIQLGDSHEGTIMQIKAKLKKGIDIIKAEKKKGTKFVFVGDCVEGRAIDNPFYDSDINTQPIPYRQADEVIKDFECVAGQCLAWLEGNHDLYSRMMVRLVQDVVCDPRGLDVPYGTWSCKITFVGGGKKWKAHFIHGSTNKGITQSRAGNPLRRKTNELDSLKNLLSVACGDAVYHGVGHYHKQLIYEPQMGMDLYITDDGEEFHQKTTAQTGGEYIPPDLRWYGCSGAFMRQYIKGVSTYGEKAIYKPVEIGMLRLKVRNWELVGVEKIPL